MLGGGVKGFKKQWIYDQTCEDEEEEEACFYCFTAAAAAFTVNISAVLNKSIHMLGGR